MEASHLKGIPFDQFKIVRKIGEGVNGEVYEAIWQGQSVALKKYKQKDADIGQEEAALTAVSHDHVIKLLGSTTDMDGYQMLVMEYMAEGSLHDLLRQPDVPLYRQHKLQIAIDIAEGLKYLHEHQPHKILHRDLKPDNILLFDNKTRAKISDFGCARILINTSTETCAGALYYMAPEVVNMQKYNEKADIYSFGALLYTLMHPPTVLLMDESLRKSQLNAVTDPKLMELLLKCCSTKPDQRPSAAECVDALNKLKNRTILSVTEKLAKSRHQLEIEPEQFWSIKKLREQLFPFPTPTNRVMKIPVKIFVVPCYFHTPSLIKQLLLPDLMDPRSILFGFARVGLQFGNVVLNCVYSDLVHVSEPKSSKATMLFDVAEVYYTPELDQKVIDFIVDWNARKFSLFTNSSQIFVAEFLEQVLQINIKNNKQLNAPLNRYLFRIKIGGGASPVLVSNNHGNFVFRSHEELEEFDSKRAIDATLPPSERKWNFTDAEVKLLKAFHRGFQLRENAAGKDSSGCMYGPIETIVESTE